MDTPLTRSDLSNDRLARELLARWSRADRTSPKPGARSIGAKVGLLRKGTMTWWRGQDGALRALADVLGCAPEELVPPTPEAGAARLQFDDFPLLRALRPGEQGCPVGASMSLEQSVGAHLRSGGATWIIAPAGCGKRLTIESLRAKGNLSVDLHEVLLDAARDKARRSAQPVVVAIRRPDPTTDRTALAELRQHEAGVVVMAAFAPPATDGEWNTLRWQLAPRWRDTFIDWCARRLDDPGRLDPHDLKDWLGEVDPAARFIDSPGALLPLLAWAHAHGTPELDRLTDAAVALVRDRLRRRSGAVVPLETLGAALRDLVVGALRREVETGARPTTLAEWRALLPPATSALPTRQLHEQIGAARSASRKGERDRHLETLEQLVSADVPGQMVAALDASGLLEPGEHGFEIHPPWMRFTFERALIATTAGEQPWKVWGRWAAHPRLRSTVVDALARLEHGQLLRVVETVLSAPHGELAYAAAVEALFEAAAFRLDVDVPDQSKWRPTGARMELLTRLGAAQADLVALGLRARGDDYPCCTTATPARGTDERVTWIARAWNYSLAVHPPPSLPEEATWAFPAWAADLGRSVYLPILDATRGAPAESWAAYDHLIRVARRLVRARPDATKADAWAPHVAALIEGVAPVAALAGEVLHGRGSEMLARAVRDEPVEVRALAARGIWAQLPRRSGNPMGRLSEAQYAGVRDLLLADLPAETFVEAIDPHNTVVELIMFERPVRELPLRLRESLFAAIASHAVAYEHAHSLRIEHALGDLEAFDTLAKLASIPGPAGDAAARRGWELDGQRSLSALDDALASNTPAAESWIGTCPADQAQDVAERVLRARPSPGANVRRWLAGQVAMGSQHAPGLYELLVRLDAA